MNLRTPRRRLASDIAVAGLAFLISIVLAEVLLRSFGPRQSGYYVHRPGSEHIFVPAPDVFPGVVGPARFSVNSLGLRGTELPDDSSVFRILAVGGSTTENLYLDNSETWTDVLSQRLSTSLAGRTVWIGAAGRAGLNARDHLVQVTRLLPQLPRIDLVLVLVGVNDLTVTLAQGDDYTNPLPMSQPQVWRRHELRSFTVVPGRMHQSSTEYYSYPWYKRLALWQVAAQARQRVMAVARARHTSQTPGGESLQQWRVYRQQATRIRDDLPDLEQSLSEYRITLEEILNVGAQRSVPVAFITQPFLWRSDLSESETRLLWLGGIGDFQSGTTKVYFSLGALAKAMSDYNRALLHVCVEQGAPCFDLASELAPTVDNFFDDVHFTEMGNRVIGELLAEWLVATFDSVSKD